MSRFSDSDEDGYYGARCGTQKLAASLESKLAFAAHSRSTSDQEEGAWQSKGGAKKKYTRFYVESLGESEDEDEFEPYEFSVTVCENQPQSNHTPQSNSVSTASGSSASVDIASDITSGFGAEDTGEVAEGNGGCVPPERWVGLGEEEDDDGWHSGEEGFQVTTSPTSVPSVYRTCGYGEWEDELLAEFESSWKTHPQRLLSLLREMFEEHKDVHDLVCYFLRSLGRRRPNNKRHTFYKALLDEFQKWKRDKKKAGNLPDNAVLTESHQKEALSVLKRGNTTYLDSLTAIFQLRSAPRSELVRLVKQVLEAGRLKEGVVFIYTFGIQEQFRMEETLLPLIAFDQINLIENYIDGSKELQVKFTSLLDKLCEPGKTIHLLSLYLGDCKWVDSDSFLSPSSKLNSKQLLKLGLRFILKYKLDLDLFPNLSMKKSSGFLHHILHLHYEEKSVTAENMDDLLEPAVVGKDSRIQLQLVCELLHFNDTPAAARWGLRCGLPASSLPYTVQTYISKHKQSLLRQLVKGRRSSTSRRDSTSSGGGNYLTLPIPLSAVVFVDNRDSLQLCWEAITKVGRPGAVIGIDSEWKLIIDSSKERLAVLQLALREQVFILDMIALPQVSAPKTLRHFMHNLLGSNQNLKLGYGVGADLKMLMRSWPFVSDIVLDPERLVDLKVLDEMVEELRNPSCPDPTSDQQDSGDTSQAPPKTMPTEKNMPVHPIYHKSTATAGTKNPLPPHPLLANQIKPLPPSHPTSPRSASTATSAGSQQATPTNSLGKPPSGLSSLVDRYLGSPLDKSQQLSDWERRPLRREQVAYAALDAHCLLSVYEQLAITAITLDPDFDIAPQFHFNKPHPQPTTTSQ